MAPIAPWGWTESALTIGIGTAALNRSVARLGGGLIGRERQWRQRLAGLRTNTRVAPGAASFVVFAMVFADAVSPTRVAAPVVSGIGFLGAGLIFREALRVRGLNTAATRWCSAAVGVLAGAWVVAALVRAMVIFVNRALRPPVQRRNRQPSAGAEQAKITRSKSSAAPRPRRLSGR
jgi:putative Mg2+ transporter-C (MgtC) family protein